MALAVAYRDDLGLRLTQNFWLGEFTCRCSKLRRQPAEGFCNGAVRQDTLIRLVNALQNLRERWGTPFYIESGYRCWAYHEHLYDEINKEREKKGLPKRRPPINSAHLYGLAADFWPKGKPLEKSDEIRGLLRACGFLGVGWNLGSAKNKIHLDVMGRGGGNGKLVEWDYA